MTTPATTLPNGIVDRIMRDYAAVAARLPDAPVTHEARARAMHELSRLGWPTTRDEQWRYSNLRAFERVPGFCPGSAGARARRYHQSRAAARPARL